MEGNGPSFKVQTNSGFGVPCDNQIVASIIRIKKATFFFSYGRKTVEFGIGFVVQCLSNVP